MAAAPSFAPRAPGLDREGYSVSSRGRAPLDNGTCVGCASSAWESPGRATGAEALRSRKISRGSCVRPLAGARSRCCRVLRRPSEPRRAREALYALGEMSWLASRTPSLPPVRLRGCCSFMNGTVEGEDVFIPLDHVIGGRSRAGFGWNMLMDCLAEGRGVSLPAMSTAASKLTVTAVGAYARIRNQFKVGEALGGLVRAPVPPRGRSRYRSTGVHSRSRCPCRAPEGCWCFV